MLNSDIIRFAEEEDVDRLVSFLESIANDFSPRLDERKNSIRETVDFIRDKGKVAIYERKGEIVATTSYRPVDEDTIWSAFNGVSRGHRGSLVFFRLLKYVVNEESDSRYKKVRTKTWPENTDSRRVMEKLGFEKVRTIIDHTCNDGTTVIYEADMNSLKDYFGQPLHSSCNSRE